MSETFFNAIERYSKKRKVRVGDFLECNDKEEMLEMICDNMANAGIEVEICYEINGNKGLWLEIKGVSE